MSRNRRAEDRGQGRRVRRRGRRRCRWTTSPRSTSTRSAAWPRAGPPAWRSSPARNRAGTTRRRAEFHHASQGTKILLSPGSCPGAAVRPRCPAGRSPRAIPRAVRVPLRRRRARRPAIDAADRLRHRGGFLAPTPTRRRDEDRGRRPDLRRLPHRPARREGDDGRLKGVLIEGGSAMINLANVPGCHGQALVYTNFFPAAVQPLRRQRPRQADLARQRRRKAGSSATEDWSSRPARRRRTTEGPQAQPARAGSRPDRRAWA